MPTEGRGRRRPARPGGASDRRRSRRLRAARPAAAKDLPTPWKARARPPWRPRSSGGPAARGCSGSYTGHETSLRKDVRDALDGAADVVRQQRDRCNHGQRDDGKNDTVLRHRLPLLAAAESVGHVRGKHLREGEKLEHEFTSLRIFGEGRMLGCEGKTVRSLHHAIPPKRPVSAGPLPPLSAYGGVIRGSDAFGRSLTGAIFTFSGIPCYGAGEGP